MRDLARVPEILVPYTEFEAGDLAAQLHGAVRGNMVELGDRNLVGVMLRYGYDLERAEAKVRKGQNEHDEIGHFAVVDFMGDVVGAASIYPGLPLRKLRLPLPPAAAVGPLAVEYPYADPNVHAWTVGPERDLLADAYKDLVFRSMGTFKRADAKKPWTIEPVASPKHVHESIVLGGLEAVATRRYDDGESRRRVPPRSVLYAHLYGEWTSAGGKESELRKNKKSILTTANLWIAGQGLPPNPG